MFDKSLVAILIAFSLLAAACSGGEASRKDNGNAAESQVAGSDNAADGTTVSQADVADSELIPVVNSPQQGPADAPVTIVVFSDFQCSFCGRAASIMDRLLELEEYQGKIRLVFKHYPLDFHRQAKSASRAAMAAGEQDKFWAMHDMIFDNQSALRGKDTAQVKELTAGFAEQLGLDVEQFEADFDKQAYATEIQEDLQLAEKLDLSGTPQFFVNGFHVPGAQPLEIFRQVVDMQLELAAEKRGEGVPADQMYQTLVAANRAEAQARAEIDAKPPEPEQIVAMVPVDKDDAVKGSADKALVTIVEFSDFQCPHCRTASSTVEQIEQEYGDKVRVVFKHRPMSFHPQAEEAAKLAIAAQEEGKFWQMHDLLFENQQALRQEETFVELGKKVGLSKKEVDKALASEAYGERVDEDVKLAREVGAHGTPTFYVNGIQVVGALPFRDFKPLIDEQIATAEKLQKDEKVTGEKLYEAAVAHNKATTPGATSADAGGDDQPFEPVDTSQLTIDKDQVKGPADAKVTVFVFSDFQCPYCRDGAQNFAEALEDHKDEVKVVYKHIPLPNHPQAVPAAKAAMAAGEQDKFWAMHDLLFQNQTRLAEEGIYVELAKKLGLDVEQFKKDMGNKAYVEQLKNDVKQAQAVGVQATPWFFIDGIPVVGAQEAETFETVIEEALSEKQ